VPWSKKYGEGAPPLPSLLEGRGKRGSLAVKKVANLEQVKKPEVGPPLLGADRLRAVTFVDAKGAEHAVNWHANGREAPAQSLSARRKLDLPAMVSVHDPAANQARVKKLVTRTVFCSRAGEETGSTYADKAECLKVEFKQIACEEEVIAPNAGEAKYKGSRLLDGTSIGNSQELVLLYDGKEFVREGPEPMIIMPCVDLPVQMELFFVYNGKFEKEYRVIGHKFVLKLGEAGAVAAGCCTIA